MSNVLIRGISGQSGQILSKLLKKDGHTIFGLTHTPTPSIDKTKNFKAVYCWDGSSLPELQTILSVCAPEIVFNLAAAHTSSEKKAIDRDVLLSVNFTSLALLIEALYTTNPSAMLVNASSSHIYTPSKISDVVSESTRPEPMNFYGCTKLLGMQLIDFYRINKGFIASNVILFNHESEYRTAEFVSRKISMAAAKIKLGLESELHLKNIAAHADFSCAYDVMRALMKIGLMKLSTDLIVSSGKATSIADLVIWAFSEMDLDWKNHIRSESSETGPFLIGDNTKMKTLAKWEPANDIQAAIKRMVRIDYDSIKSSTCYCG